VTRNSTSSPGTRVEDARLAAADRTALLSAGLASCTTGNEIGDLHDINGQKPHENRLIRRHDQAFVTGGRADLEIEAGRTDGLHTRPTVDPQTTICRIDDKGGRGNRRQVNTVIATNLAT
jgi:hypothetical protein